MHVSQLLQLKPNLDGDRDPMAGIMDLMKVSTGLLCGRAHREGSC